MTKRLKLSREEMKGLIDRKLPWLRLKEIMPARRDSYRFDTYIQVLQEMAPWKEQIVLPIHEHLSIVNKKGEFIVKAWCGHEVGDYRENWKLQALIYIRDSMGKFTEVFMAPVTFDPDVVEIREFFCPRCGTLLDVECVPPGYPIEFEFLPDLQTFYRDWLGKELPPGVKDAEFEDRSGQVTQPWAPVPDGN